MERTADGAVPDEKVEEGVKTVVAVVSDAAKTVGTAIKSAALAVGDLIVQGAKAVWEGLKEAASFVVKLVCDAVAGFLDTVVKGLVRGFLEMAKWVVYIGGKMIAKVQGRSRAAVACVRRLGLGPFRSFRCSFGPIESGMHAPNHALSTFV